jgi:hypothetical protein
MDAGKKSIGDIFNRTRILEIPYFRRSYVWKKEEWQKMLDDMEMVCATNTHYQGRCKNAHKQTTTHDYANYTIQISRSKKQNKYEFFNNHQK